MNDEYRWCLKHVELCRLARIKGVVGSITAVANHSSYLAVTLGSLARWEVVVIAGCWEALMMIFHVAVILWDNARADPASASRSLTDHHGEEEGFQIQAKNSSLGTSLSEALSAGKLAISQKVGDPSLAFRGDMLVFVVASEITELLVPISYAALFMICRYGRNGQYMGGVGASIWHYQRVPTDAEFLRNIGIWIAQELVFLLLPHYALKRYSGGKIQFRVIACTLGKNYWWGIFCTYGWILYHQMCITIVHCGMDMTFADMTTDRGRWTKDYDNPLGLDGGGGGS